jgi:hypothetical protein
MILQNKCQSDENAKDFEFSQGLVERHGETEEQPQVGKSPPAARSGTPRGRQEDQGEPFHAEGFLKPDPDRVRQGTWLLDVKNV